MLTIVRTRWPEEDDGIMLVDFDTEKVTDERHATRAIESALYECALAHQGDDMDVGELVGCLDEETLARHGARALGAPFMVVSLDGYASPLRDFAPPEGTAATTAKEGPKVDETGLSLAIQFHVRPESEMLAAGFRIPYEGADHYYLCRMVESDISMNVTVPMDGSRGRIDVLDEEFCQPYDYQHMLSQRPHHPFATKVKDKVDDEMERLVEAKILSGWSRGDYI